jgi:adenosylcobinamide-phosphate synthase
LWASKIIGGLARSDNEKITFGYDILASNMKEITVNRLAAGQRIEKFVRKYLSEAPLGFIYKAVNTMDSMVGYHNDRYEYFGKAAAKMDDVVNFVPARISAVFMIIAAFISGSDYSGKGALRIFLRDRYKHKSPNSAQTEAVCAGALSIRLAGDASYFGKIVKKPFIGDDVREVECADIKRMCKLMYATEYICFIVVIIIGTLITGCRLF